MVFNIPLPPIHALLFRYVDLQRGHWIRQNVSEAEELYNHVGEMFNIFQSSAYFKKEETNFQSANEIDVMSLLMPTAGVGRPGRAGGTGGEAAAATAAGGGGSAPTAAGRPQARAYFRYGASKNASFWPKSGDILAKLRPNFAITQATL